MKAKLDAKILRTVMGQTALFIGLSLVAGMFTIDRARLSTDNSVGAAAPDKAISSVSLEQLRDGLVTGEVICVDARSSSEFKNSHVRGAISLPLSNFDQGLAANLDLFVHNKPIIIYCGGEGCDLSHLLARKLMQTGFDRVSVLTEGWTGWNAASLPIEP